MGGNAGLGSVYGAALTKPPRSFRLCTRRLLGFEEYAFLHAHTLNIAECGGNRPVNVWRLGVILVILLWLMRAVSLWTCFLGVVLSVGEC